MSNVRAPLLGVALVVAVLNLGACGSEGVTVPPGADALDTCDSQRIEVVDLAGMGEPGCDLEGSSLVFPDGSTVEIEAVGNSSAFSTSSLEGVEFYYGNWGVPGVSASVVESGQLVDLWASTPEAYELELELLRIGDIDTD
ncbi:hypothetical protein [Demequina sp. NBRC 110056]|uniref:hypothetical protein n=1 Tax=Demequina sp. NBRC 110056 TaxID=1570345 RepID=UPI00118166AE|nr:hypothetical protein [Demequina sp. NBRC 110056]